MPLTSDRDIKLLTKLAEKRGYPGDINRMRKLVSAHASRSHVSPPVALVFLANERGIRTAVYEKQFDTTQKTDLSRMHQKRPVPQVSKNPTKKRKMERTSPKLIDYDTDNHFKKGHIDELNRAYANSCYTAVFILARKIIENLIIDILRKKYPESIRENKELYFDTARARFKDFEVILKNLNSKKDEFGSENKAVEKLCREAKELKDDANDKTHSWYHLVRRKKEIDDLDLKAIFKLIDTLEKVVGIR